MPTFTSTRDIFRLEGVSVEDIAGARIPAGTQLTSVNLVAIDQLSPTASAALQDNDARALRSETFSNFQGQGARVGPAEYATIIIDGVVVASTVPTIVTVDFAANSSSNVEVNGVSLFSPRFFEIDGTVYLVPRESNSELAGVTEITEAFSLSPFTANGSIVLDAFGFQQIDAPEVEPPADPEPVDPPADPDPVDPPVDPDPVEPEPEPVNVIEGGAGRDRLNGTRDDDVINGNGGNDRINGGNGDDIIDGGAGRDVIRGGRGDDTIDGGTGNDILFGNGGADTFVFGNNSGNDQIRGFRSNDVIDLSEVDALNSITDVANALTQTRSGALLDLGDDGSVLLRGTSISTLEADDFVF